jgi:uncharacterized protein YaiI (UPF0178 family)
MAKILNCCNVLKRIDQAMASRKRNVNFVARRGRPGLVLLVAAILVSHAVADKVFYRYKNEQGITVQADRLPPEVVSRGYEVVSANGDVLKTIPRELSESELKLRATEQEERQREIERQEKIQKWDKSLVLRYSNVEEIEAAKQRAVKEYDTRIGILNGNLMSLKGQIETEQNDAANYARRGQSAPDALLGRLDALKSEVLYAETAIDDLRQERVATELQFELDKERFNYLMDLAGKRQ